MDQTDKPSFFKRHKKLMITFGVLIFLFLGLAYYVGFQHVPHHVRYLWQAVASTPSDIDNEQTQAAMGTSVPVADTTAVVSAPDTPLDTLMWANAIKNGDYIPDGVKEELEMIRKADFSKLTIARDKPSDLEIKQAIVRRFGEEAIKLLQENDATLRGGKAYHAPLQNTAKNGQEIARVTMMVTGFNSKNINLMNIQLPMLPAYDFVKFESDPDTWYVTDLSQTIPFDYKLNKR